MLGSLAEPSVSILRQCACNGGKLPRSRDSVRPLTYALGLKDQPLLKGLARAPPRASRPR